MNNIQNNNLSTSSSSSSKSSCINTWYSSNNKRRKCCSSSSSGGDSSGGGCCTSRRKNVLVVAFASVNVLLEESNRKKRRTTTRRNPLLLVVVMVLLLLLVVVTIMMQMIVVVDSLATTTTRRRHYLFTSTMTNTGTTGFISNNKKKKQQSLCAPSSNIVFFKKATTLLYNGGYDSYEDSSSSFGSSSTTNNQQQQLEEQKEDFPLATEIFPNCGTYDEIFNQYMLQRLEEYNFFLKETLVATSICGDEMNRPLLNLLTNIFPHSYSLGGLAGYPFGGVTAFRKMKKHIPHDAYEYSDTSSEYNGNAVIVYGPHVGISSRGNVGHVDRLNVDTFSQRNDGEHTMCCRSAILAAQHVGQVYRGEITQIGGGNAIDMMDVSQHYVKQSLMPYAEHLETFYDRNNNEQRYMMELPYVLFEQQSQMLNHIISEGSSSDESIQYGNVATFGGIQINTPIGYKDYFLPMKFDLYDPKGYYVTNMF